MITQCPACSTLFRVVPDQLRISEGWVRCGQCGEVFDASVHLLQEPLPEEPGAAAAAAAPAPGGVAGELDTTAAPLEPADEDESPPATGSVDVLLEDLGTPPHRPDAAWQAVPPVPPVPPVLSRNIDGRFARFDRLRGGAGRSARHRAWLGFHA